MIKLIKAIIDVITSKELNNAIAEAKKENEEMEILNYGNIFSR